MPDDLVSGLEIYLDYPPFAILSFLPDLLFIHTALKVYWFKRLLADGESVLTKMVESENAGLTVTLLTLW